MTPQPTSPAPVEGSISGLLAFGVCVAVSLISLIVALELPRPQPDPQAARAAIQDAGPAAPPWLISARREEVLWQLGGDLALLPPWAASPGQEPWIALAHDPGLLPASLLAQAQSAPHIAHRDRWSAMRVGGGPWVNLSMDKAVVEVLPHDPKQERRLCGPLRLGQWRCGPEAWSYVGPSQIQVQGAASPCLWLHPVPGAELRVTWPEVPTGVLLEGRAALDDAAARTAGGAPIQWRVQVEDREVLRQTHANRPGWRPFQIDLRQYKQPHVSLQLSVEASQTGRRLFCLSLWPQERAHEP